jgi:hypothetical protein
MSIDKCIGDLIEVIYMDSKGKFTKRRVKLNAIAKGRAIVFDMEKKAVRTLVTDRILAIRPIKRHSA